MLNAYIMNYVIECEQRSQVSVEPRHFKLEKKIMNEREKNAIALC